MMICHLEGKPAQIRRPGWRRFYPWCRNEQRGTQPSYEPRKPGCPMSDGIIISWGLDEDEKPVAFHEAQYSSKAPSIPTAPAREHDEAPAPQKARASASTPSPANDADKQRIQSLEAEIHHLKTDISLRDNRIHVLTQKLNDALEENKKLERLLQQAETTVEGEKKKPWWKKA